MIYLHLAVLSEILAVVVIAPVFDVEYGGVLINKGLFFALNVYAILTLTAGLWSRKDMADDET